MLLVEIGIEHVHFEVAMGVTNDSRPFSFTSRQFAKNIASAKILHTRDDFLHMSYSSLKVA